MASVSQVRTYLAYWFQLGKPVVFNRSQTQCLPYPIFQGTCLSPAFEQCWQKITRNTADCYLQGTDQTIADLLATEWEITECARCSMPVPMPVCIINSSACPCNDLPNWPNDEIPQPRMGVSNESRLEDIRKRLSIAEATRDRLQFTYELSPGLPSQTPAKPQPDTQDTTKAAGS